MIVTQSNHLPDQDDVKKSKTEALCKINKHSCEKAKNIKTKQKVEMVRTLEQLSEPGASSWLGALPLKDQGFNLNKSEFQDALNLRYDKPLKNLPSKCPCGVNFNVTCIELSQRWFHQCQT